jgi:large subunit ribosomal protein L21
MRGLSDWSLSMYAVIATGGKQYRVEKDSLLKVEKLDAEAGSTVSFDQVLLVADGADIKVGKPLVDGAKVSATVEKHGQGEKKVIVKFRRRKHYKRGGNHRQEYTLVKITGIA